MNQKSIIVALGVAVVILIGITVYFATINRVGQSVVPAQKVVQQPVQTPAVQPVPATPIAPSNQNFFVVKELGIKLPVDSAMVDDLTYKISAGGSAVFSSKSLTTANKFCGDGASGAAIAKISGTPAKSSEPEFYKAHISSVKQFDGFFLFYGGPQDSCTMGKNVDLENKVSQTVFEGFKQAVLITQ